jgi:hypothetical protein
MSGKHRKLILAAANRFDVFKDGEFLKTITLVDSCHMGRNMQGVSELLREQGFTIKAAKDYYDRDRSQGFIDESCNYHDRKEAYKIAKSSGQLFNDEFTLPRNRLDSSCIRHIKNT